MTDNQILNNLMSTKVKDRFALVISKNEVNLNENNDNKLYIFEFDVSGSSAGGRAGGFGQRRIIKLHVFSQHDNQIKKLLEISDIEKLNNFDIPYNVSLYPIVLDNNEEIMAYNLIDSDLIMQYEKLFEK